jgi:hypothetical protein
MANSERSEFAREARNVRRQAQRRIQRLQSTITDEQASAHIRDWAIRTTNKIKANMEYTKLQVNVNGKRITYELEDARKGLEELKRNVSEVAPRYNWDEFGDNFSVTQSQLNLASANKPSVYTKQEAKTFYRATQKIWQREGVGEHNRNEAILDYVNDARAGNDLSPITLDQLVQYVLDANETALSMQDLDPSEYMDVEQAEMYAKAQEGDNADNDKTSPTNEVVARAIEDALEDLLDFPTDVFGEF